MRNLHHPDALRKLLAPKSLAVVGVSERSGSFGLRTWQNLSEYTGRRFAVNPRYPSYDGASCFPDIASLPETPDCVLICTPQELVEPVLRQCVDRGVGGVVVYASGYAEIGTLEGRQNQARLLHIARSGSMLLLGPNCMGLIHNASRAGLTFAPSVPFCEASQHAIALVSQSGAIGFSLLQAVEHGTVFSHMLTSGNACDVDIADQIAYLAEDECCKAIALVFESISDPTRLIEAGLRARKANKPVVVFKVARSEMGSVAAASHTGALAGSDSAYKAAFKLAGMVLVDEIEHLLETAVFLAKTAALPAAVAGVAVISASGGLGIMAADKATDAGVDMPQPTAETIAVLESRIPPFGVARNPCDVTAGVVNDIESLEVCSSALLADATFGALVYPHTGANAAGTERLKVLEKGAARHRKVACMVWATAWLEGPGAIEVEHMRNAALFRSMKSCFVALAARNALQLHGEQSACAALVSSAHLAQAAALLASCPSDALTEAEGMQLLEVGGIRVVRDRVVTDADGAAAAATSLGYPVVMKILSRDIAHKTDAGGVVLNVRSQAEAHGAFSAIMQRVKAAQPRAALEGVVVQPMVPAGIELFMGAKRDPVFGSIVVVGFGGIFIELMQDVAVRLTPCSPAEATEMLQELRGFRLLRGFRGLPAVDVALVAETIARFSELVAALGSHIDEIDVNPLICAADQVIAVDALIRRSAAPLTAPHPPSRRQDEERPTRNPAAACGLDPGRHLPGDAAGHGAGLSHAAHTPGGSVRRRRRD